MAGIKGQGRKHPALRCPEPTHRGSNVVAHSSKSTNTGKRRVYRCEPLNGGRHFFTVVIADDDAAPSTPRPTRVRQPAPRCEEHPAGHVVRDGTYGKRSPLPRQRYRCYPDPTNKKVFHSFTPALPRQHIHPAGEQCDTCDEMRGVHHGEPAVARQHSWPSRTVARGLEQLAAGSSYAEVSRWALRAEAAELERAEREGRGRPKPVKAAAAKTKPANTKTKPANTDTDTDTNTKPDDAKTKPADIETKSVRRRPRRTSVKAPIVITTADGKQRRRSRASVEAKNVWHIAADWCEVFGPVVWGPIEDRLRARALTERARLDALTAAGAKLDRPQVLLIDDMPIYGRDSGGAANRKRRDSGFFLLAAAEVAWSAPDPWDSLQLPIPTTDLRLVRAFPKSNTPAWRLLFDELGYTPDFVVADAGTGQYAAVQAHYPHTVFVPSVWHVATAIRAALRDVPNAHQATVAGKVLDPELDEHLKLLRRGTPALDSIEGLEAWWDALLAWASRRRIPVEKLDTRRRDYEGRMKAALPLLIEHPEVPISTGGLETIQRRVIEPVLAGRRSVFGNVERTNTLLDLAVAREHGAFDDLAEVARILRTDATGEAGWAPPLRSVADPGGTKGRYSSLRDATLLTHLAAARGLK